MWTRRSWKKPYAATRPPLYVTRADEFPKLMASFLRHARGRLPSLSDVVAPSTVVRPSYLWAPCYLSQPIKSICKGTEVPVSMALQAAKYVAHIYG